MFLLFFLLMLLCSYFKFYNYSFAKNVAIFPKCFAILGNIIAFINKDQMLIITDLARESLRNGGIVCFLYGPIPMYVISDPVMAAVVLTKCLQKSVTYNLLQPLFGNILMSATVPAWKRNRRLTDLYFKTHVVDSYIPKFNAQTIKLLQAIDSKAGCGYVDITSDITLNVLDTALQTIMGVKPGNQKYVNEKYVSAYRKLFEITTLRFLKPWLLLDLTYYFSGLKRVFDKSLTAIYEVSTEVVPMKKYEYLNRLNNGKPIQEISFLDIVIENTMANKENQLNDEEVGKLCNNVMPATFDTATFQILYTMVCIGSSEKIQRKIRREIEDVLGEEEFVRKEHLPKLVYLEAAIKESVRLYPIAPVVGRKATEAVRLSNSTLPAGSEIIIHLWAINRNKKYWGADADDYNPDRWLRQPTSPQHPNALGSFSFGKRNCNGKQYAMMLMKITLVQILRKYRIIADHTKMEFKCDVMLKAKAGHLMKFEPW